MPFIHYRFAVFIKAHFQHQIAEAFIILRLRDRPAGKKIIQKFFLQQKQLAPFFPQSRICLFHLLSARYGSLFFGRVQLFSECSEIYRHQTVILHRPAKLFYIFGCHIVQRLCTAHNGRYMLPAVIGNILFRLKKIAESDHFSIAVGSHQRKSADGGRGIDMKRTEKCK